MRMQWAISVAGLDWGGERCVVTLSALPWREAQDFGTQPVVVAGIEELVDAVASCRGGIQELYAKVLRLLLCQLQVMVSPGWSTKRVVTLGERAAKTDSMRWLATTKRTKQGSSRRSLLIENGKTRDA